MTSLNQLASVLRLPPPTLSALRVLSLDDIARLTQLIDQARAKHRVAMEDALASTAPALPVRSVYRRATQGRRV